MRWPVAFVVVLAPVVALVQPAAAQDGAVSVSSPSWDANQSGCEDEMLYPPKARAQGWEGAATLMCRIRKDRSLSHCEVTDEAPYGAGFGEAALEMAKCFRMKARFSQQSTVKRGYVEFPIRFKLAADAPPAASAKP